MRIVLCQPQIPPNTGNVIRLAANIGAELDLIHPLGFEADDARMRRAGLDYAELAVITHWPDFTAWRRAHPSRRVWAATKYGNTPYDTVAYRADDALVFGAETCGLPRDIVAAANAAIVIPMRPGNRSLNLGNSVAVVAFEAWRQLGFT